ncbi:hypothetical protein BDV95DRAFT_666450 [Massariosphaeria phaeospora]|uniref:Uncharacterized protein n=1 Tax=Massariosphaeria phaeospora TaxID=100035 RepID=A0A7C8IEZ6_9PLEO|nr:hypothetical protein BDV95DRAFT_666450 [Massariosphaeria phaeospora]
MSLTNTTKRPRDDDDDDDDGEDLELRPVQAPRIEQPLHPSHPYRLLEHLVKEVLPHKCKSQPLLDFYSDQLADPDAAIELCKGKLSDWVLEFWNKGRLYDRQWLKTKAVTQFPHHGVGYLILLDIEGQERRYVGQTENGHHRITLSHQSEAYRNVHPSFLYFLFERATTIHYLLPISDTDLAAGPILNILEQWLGLIFRSLQLFDLKNNLDAESFKWIRGEELDKGVNVREPLGQGFSFADYPMRSNSFKYAKDTLKREWYGISRNREITPRRESFLKGEIFDGSFWNAPGWYGGADYEFQIWSVRFRVGRSHIDRFEEASIRVWCELLPDGYHPESVISSLGSPKRYNGPARRLGIKISGVRKCDNEEGFVWVRLEGDPDKSIPRANRLVDWLEDLDPDELRPRRWYPANKRLDRPRCGYTGHPLDLGDAWIVIMDNNGFVR